MYEAKYAPGAEELRSRLERYTAALTRRIPGWDTALIADPVNLYYFTGTMQDSLLVLKRSGDARLFVRRSFERARAESAFPDIVQMNSYAQVAADFGSSCGITVIEKETMSLKMLDRLEHHLQFGRLRSAEPSLDYVRARKSPWELAIMRESGELHYRITEELIPSILREGMSEVEFYTELRARATLLGHQGVTRFRSRFALIDCCQFGFSENGLVPTAFDSPGGMRGMSPAVPGIGQRDRKLRRGDIIMVDFGCGLAGYQTDRTRVYSFGAEPAPEWKAQQDRCVRICLEAASMLRPGACPQDIYAAVMPAADDPFDDGFMGPGRDKVKFLGHSIGLSIDERPAIAKGFAEPLAENMTIALEPKKWVPGAGCIGVEDTFLVTPQGGECLTGGPGPILRV